MPSPPSSEWPLAVRFHQVLRTASPPPRLGPRAWDAMLLWLRARRAKLLGDTLLLLASCDSFERAAAASLVHSLRPCCLHVNPHPLILGHPTFAELLPRSSHSRAAS